MEQGIAGQGGEGADKDVVALLAHHLGGADGLQLAFFQGFGVFLGEHQTQAGEQGDHVDGEGHEERVTPAPAQEIRGAQTVIEKQEQGAGNDEAQRGAQLPDHGVPATLFLWCVKGQQRGQTIPGAAESHPLHDAEQGQQGNGVATQLLVPGQEGDAGGGGAQQEQGGGEFDAATPMTLDGHEQGGTEGPGHKRQGKQGEGIEHAL